MAGLTFLFTKMMTEARPDAAPWYNFSTNQANKSRTYVNTEGRAGMPDSVRNVLVTVKKHTAIGDACWGLDATTWIETQEPLFLLSYAEYTERPNLKDVPRGVGPDRLQRYLAFSSHGCTSLAALVPNAWGRDFNDKNNQVYVLPDNLMGPSWLNPLNPSVAGFGYYPAFCM